MEDRLATAMGQLVEEIWWLRREVEILRQYGNKDCTAAANEVLEIERAIALRAQNENLKEVLARLENGHD
jgi:hypothetical protein